MNANSPADPAAPDDSADSVARGAARAPRPVLGHTWREVMEAAANQQVRRESSFSQNPLLLAAGLPALGAEPGSPDAITDDDRRAAAQAPSRPLAEILEHRRSHTDGLTAMSRADLVTVLYRAYRLLDTGRDEETGASWTQRPTPSAGAAHPFDLMVRADDVQGLNAGTYIFGSHAISLKRLDPAHEHYASNLGQAVRRAARRTHPSPATIYLVANPARTAVRYEAPETLILRDAGALLATMHLVATDLGLRSSIVGTAGRFADIHGRTEDRESSPDNQAPVVEAFDCGALVIGRPRPGQL